MKSFESNNPFKDSLTEKLLRSLAFISAADGSISDEEIQYVRDYLGLFYNSDDLEKLVTKFKDYALNSLEDSYNEIASVFQNTSIADKLLCLIKSYQIAESGGVLVSERAAARKLAEMLEISESDFRYIEKEILKLQVLGDENLSPIQTTDFTFVAKPSIEQISLTGKSGGRLSFLKIFSSLYINTENNSDIKVNGIQLIPNVLLKLKNEDSIYFNEKEISIRAVLLNFEVRSSLYQLSDQKIFLQSFGNQLKFSLTSSSDAIAQFNFNYSSEEIIPKANCELMINGESIEERRQFSIFDKLEIKGEELNLLSLYSFLLSKLVIHVDFKSELIISNHPNACLYVADQSDKEWSLRLRMQDDQSFLVSIKDCPYPIFLNQKPLKKDAKIDLAQNSVLFVNGNSFILNVKYNLAIKRRNFIGDLSLRSIEVRTSENKKLLDNVTASFEKSKLTAIMGPSGCGKSTLVNSIIGNLALSKGDIFLGEQNLRAQNESLYSQIGFVSQEDFLYANLTVRENLFYTAALKFPSMSAEQLKQKVEQVIDSLEIGAFAELAAGDKTNKTISGGQRKRVNIALELLSDLEVLILDEPTSGLSSFDSAKVLSLLKALAMQGKIVITIIHQPSINLYQKFDNILIMDKGGKIVYSGSSQTALNYFIERSGRSDLEKAEMQKKREPGLIFDVLEEPILDIDGSPLKKRKKNSEDWRKSFLDHQKQSPQKSQQFELMESIESPQQIMNLKARFLQCFSMFKRNLLSKSKDKSNLLTTFFITSFLALFISFTTKYYMAEESYSFFDNSNFGSFLFLSAIVSIFLGMVGSISEVVSDYSFIIKERLYRIKAFQYIIAKLLSFLCFGLIQTIIYTLISYFTLEIPALMLETAIFLLLCNYIGISAGLLISALPKITLNAAQNFIPLILVPQFILAGGFLPFDQLNPQIVIMKKKEIPEISYAMPVFWAYEAMTVIFHDQNPYEKYYRSEHEKLRKMIRKIKRDADENKQKQLAGFEKKDQELEEIREQYLNLSIINAVSIYRDAEETNYMKARKSNLDLPLYNMIILFLFSFALNFITTILLSLRIRV